MFISFEGIDGSGKTTQIQNLKKFFEDRGDEVVLVREPGGTDFSEKIREFLLDKNNDIGTEAELFLFEAARSDLTRKIIKPALADGKVVICDRFFDSTSAYQGYGRGLDLSKVFSVHDIATGSLSPNVTFYLRISLATSLARNIDKAKDRMELAGDNFFEKVIHGFDDLAERFPKRIITINGEQDPEKVFSDLISHIK